MVMDETAGKKAIVIVEDTETIAQVIKDILNEEPDYKAIAVEDGTKLLEIVQSIKVSLILMDLHLPGLSGLELYDILKKNPETRDIPILFVTANHDDKGFSSRRIKKNEIIAKPFEIDDLLAKVAEICRGA